MKTDYELATDRFFNWVEQNEVSYEDIVVLDADCYPCDTAIRFSKGNLHTDILTDTLNGDYMPILGAYGHESMLVEKIKHNLKMKQEVTDVEIDKDEKRLLSLLYESLELIGELRDEGENSEDYQSVAKVISNLEDYLGRNQTIL